MDVRPAQLLHGDFLAGHGLDDLGAGDEEVGGFLHLEDEVGDRRGVDGTTGTRPHDDGDLRDHP